MATCSRKEFSPQARRAAGSDASLHRRRAAVRSFRSKTAAAGVAAVLTRCPRLGAARQHAGWRCCCRLETLPACSISSTRAARRAASRAPTGFGQADAARARSVGSVTTDSLSIKGSFCRVLALLCVDKFPILSRATTRATCTCAFSLSVCSTIRPAYITALSVHAQPALRLRELGLDARLRGAELRRRRLRELGRRPPGSF